ncbi:hypothetical protein ACFE04_010932 [Oxalis oulophora]
MRKQQSKKSPSPSPSPSPDSPIRSVFCLKRKLDIEKTDEIEDCFILDFDPNELTNYVNVNNNNDSDDLSIVAEKGQVACRDYPHSRHACSENPFDTSPHEKHCELCYCYVCDSAAPCKYWSRPGFKHCNASDKEARWRSLRKDKKRRMLKKSS